MFYNFGQILSYSASGRFYSKSRGDHIEEGDLNQISLRFTWNVYCPKMARGMESFETCTDVKIPKVLKF